MSAAIEVEQLVKSYKGLAVPAVDSISFRIEPGTFFGLLGPNGAGKTTTLSILCGLMSPTHGGVSVNGLSFSNHREEIKKLIGVVPQEIALYNTLTAFENLRFIGNMYGLAGTDLEKRIHECLSRFGLAGIAHKQVRTFSGGMKRRINLIGGILHRPKILFLDEPTVGVDVQSRAVISDYLKEMNKEGATIVYTSHLMEEAENLCSDIAIIDHGKIIARDTPSNFIAGSQSNKLEDVFLKLTGRKPRD